ncbi:hypothetical protein BCR44DRAFT_43435 [Catenaria anguillulae PL171]|uniref:MARVEL domain-containing protein n=1 Tax=Catenaria anguillulae PL171 TaxID=765915 RepID=A0A1Y2HGD1_9FUNG|nr:hypothetical protein BCR44DRAFT_43435 [Catenaria anguillulae PL171]
MSTPTNNQTNNSNVSTSADKADQVDELPTTCCCCFPIRLGVFVLIILSLAQLIYALVSDVILRTDQSKPRTRYPNDIVGYIFTGINFLVYFGLLIGAIKRDSKTYRPFAQVNLALFWVSVVLSIIGVFMSVSEFGAGALPVALVMLVFIWLIAGYFTWILYKYTDVLAKEEKGRELKSMEQA